MDKISFLNLKNLAKDAEFTMVSLGQVTDCKLVGEHQRHVIASTKTDCPPFFKILTISGISTAHNSCLDNAFFIGEYDANTILQEVLHQLNTMQFNAGLEFK